ncbi:MAG: ADP/ATP-dependent (S)-NAD(P)H-hydrate dehydratase, partial [Bacteroidota bacterium]
TILLKGRYSIIASPEGKTYVNPTGNAGMATAGSGDVLTGLIAGKLAQGYSPDHAAILGAYLHGAAGDRAAGRLSQATMLASDILQHLS